MSNTTELPVIEWLRTIADPIVRESAIRQCEHLNLIVRSLKDAISCIQRWEYTKEGFDYWLGMWDMANNGHIATIVPAATNWMQEVHTMD